MSQVFRWVSGLNRLALNQGGHVAVIFSLAILPILTITGFAIDFQATSTRKNKVQTVIDSAVLAGARAMQAGKTQTEIRQIVREYITAQVGTVGAMMTCNPATVNFTQGSQDISAAILCSQKTTLSNLLGYSEMEFKVSSVSTWGIGKLDVAFMFDVSGSMNGSRMTSLKAAALEAVDTLLPADGGEATENVRIAMVSYNSSVNAGEFFDDVTGMAATRTYYAEDKYVEWEDIIETYTENERVCDTRSVCTRFYTSGSRKGQCRPNSWTTEEYNCRWEMVEKTRTVPTPVNKTREVSKTITSTCVAERYGDHAFNDEAPNNWTILNPVAQPSAIERIDHAFQRIYNAADTSDNEEAYLAAEAYTYFVDESDAEQGNKWITGGSTCRNHKPVPLTRNRGTLTSYISGLTTGGGTAGHQGIAWAWYLVSEKWGGVFDGSTQPLPYDEPDSVKAVILMTDGEFLNAQFPSQGNSTAQAKDVCDEMKAQDKVIIYTVAFQAPQAGKNVLAYCASGPEFAFSPENGEQLSQAYQAIATSISDLRIRY